MSRKRRNKPSNPRKVVLTPEEIAAKAEADAKAMAERQAERAEDRRVKAMPGGTVNRDPRTGKTTSRQVLDVVMLMARTKDDENRPLIGAEETGAVRMLERMIEKAGGGSGSCLSTLERVNGRAAGDPALATIIRRTEAALDLKVTQKLLGPRTWAMLRELCDGNLGLARWHNVVERHSGETGQRAQGAIIRMAFRELADVIPLVVEASRERRRAADQQHHIDVAA